MRRLCFYGHCYCLFLSYTHSLTVLDMHLMCFHCLESDLRHRNLAVLIWRIGRRNRKKGGRGSKRKERKAEKTSFLSPSAPNWLFL